MKKNLCVVLLMFSLTPSFSQATYESNANCSSGVSDNACGDCVVFTTSGSSSCGGASPSFNVTGTGKLPGTTNVKAPLPPTAIFWQPALQGITWSGVAGWSMAATTVQFPGLSSNRNISECGKEGIDIPAEIYNQYIADSKLALQCYATLFKSAGKSVWSSFLDMSKDALLTNPAVMPIASCYRLYNMSTTQKQAEMAAAQAQAKALWNVFDKKIMPMLLKTILAPDPIINSAIAAAKAEGKKMSTDRRYYEGRMLQMCDKLGQFAPDIILAVMTGGGSGEAKLVQTMAQLEAKLAAETVALERLIASAVSPSSFKLELMRVAGTGQNNIVYEGFLNGVRIAAKFNKTNPTQLLLEFDDAVALERFGGPKIVGWVTNPATGERGLAMEFIDGFTFRSASNGQAVTAAHVADLERLSQTLRGGGTYFSDFNTGNLMFTPTGRVRPIDQAAVVQGDLGYDPGKRDSFYQLLDSAIRIARAKAGLPPTP